jgi:uncharacterized protein (DUF1697 family)
MVFVLADAKDRASLLPLARRDWSPDALALGPRVAYVWCRTGILDSPPAKELGRLLGERVTSRNWATVLKLAALAADSG